MSCLLQSVGLRTAGASEQITQLSYNCGGVRRGRIAAMRAAGLPIPDPSALGAVMAHPDYADSVALLPVELTIAAAAA